MRHESDIYASADPFDANALSQSAGVSFSLQQLMMRGAGSLNCWVARPTVFTPQADVGAPLIAVHGITRNAREQAKLLGKRISETGRAVIAPYFDEENWSGYQRVVDGPRADAALIDTIAQPAFDGLFHGEAPDARKFHLFGFSGGAQFAHRFAMLHPDRVLSLTIASAGWYTFPDDAPFPFGFGAAGAAKDGRSKFASIADCGSEMRANLERFVCIPTRVVVGGRDCVVDRNTRSGPQIDAQQGRTRVARARNWARAIDGATGADESSAGLKFKVLEGCGHSFAECVQVGGLDDIVAEQIAAAASTKGADA